MFDGALFGAEVVDAVRGYMERAVQPLQAELVTLRAKVSELETGLSEANRKSGVAFDHAEGVAARIDGIDLTGLASEALETKIAMAAGLSAAAVAEPLAECIAALEAREPLKGEPGDPGRDAPTAEDLAPIIEAACATVADRMRGAPGERGADGLDAAPVDYDRIVAEVRALVPTPENGREGADGVPGEPGPAGKDAEPIAPEAIAAAVSAYLEANPPPAGQDGPAGADGFSIDPAEVELMVGAMVERRVAELPAPLPGPAGEKGEPGVPGERGAAGVDGVAGPVVTGAIKDHTGELVVTFTDGMVVRTGIFDGVNGRDGEKGEPGFSLEDFDSEMRDGGRLFVVSFTAGDIKHTVEHQLDTMIYRGAYKAGAEYLPGDTVSCGGQLYHCGQQTTERPDGDSAAWSLCSRRGRDGKDSDPAPLLRLIEDKSADTEARMITRLEAYLKSKGV